MKALLACLALLSALPACRTSLRDHLPVGSEATTDAPAGPTPGAKQPEDPAFDKPAPERSAAEVPGATATPPVASLGDGASPGNARGPGGFVPRGKARNFYTGRGGRLWFYMNNYYWVSKTAPLDDLWIMAEVVEKFSDLRKWPDGKSVTGPEPKVTVEYWKVGSTRRSVRIDNHKDYCLLSDKYTAGAITVEVTLTLGRLKVKDKRDRWVTSRNGYILESRNYSGGGGLGADRSRFRPLATEAVTVWAYRVPWDTHPQRITRSSWQKLELPEWGLQERRPPPRDAIPAPVVTPAAQDPAGS